MTTPDPAPFGLSLQRTRLRRPALGYRGTDDRGVEDPLADRGPPEKRLPAAEKLTNDLRIVGLIERLQRVTGINLGAYMTTWPTHTWPHNTPGFDFESRQNRQLEEQLLASGRFVRTTRSSASVQRFREINEDPMGGSLHITLQMLAGARQPSQVHLDSIAIVPGKDPRTGQPIYTRSAPVLSKHLAIDLFGLDQGPISLP